MENGKREQPQARTPRHREQPRRQSTKKKRRFGVGFVIGTVLLIGVLTCAMIAGIFMTYVRTTLAPTLKVEVEDMTLNQSSIIYYQDKASGEWVELQTLHADENRILVEFDQIPEALWQATVSIEDERFFTHHGVDWKRTAGATVHMFTKADNTYGGSTITQQLLKNLTGDNQGTVKRKVTEIFRALEFEKDHTKQDILELYLNTIFLGNGCYGVQTAAQFYFGKDVSELSLAESACLIGITNNPSLYSPMRTDNSGNHLLRDEKFLTNNKNRQETILYKMLELGYIDQATHDAAVAETLAFAVTSDSSGADTPEDDANGTAQSYFVDQVFRDVVSDMVDTLGLSEKQAENKLLYGGCKIYTTLDPDVQAIAEDVYENNYVQLTSGSGQTLHSGITIVDVATGNVVAMVGDMGEKTGDLVWNYATDTHQCGSSIKPLSVYAPALDANAVTMASTFDNYPVRLLNGSPWPKNSPNNYTGWTTLATGVAKSINTVAVQVIEKLGIANAYQFMTENLGFTTLVSSADNASHNDINTSSLGLGGLTKGVTTEQMAAAYASFANDGVYNSPRLYTRVTDAEGNVLIENETETHVAMKETTAYFMNKLLQGVVTSGTGTSANFGGMAIAGKTGTTTDNYDRYFAGYTPYYSAAVWTGYKNNERIVYSGNPALTMWRRVMERIHEDLEYKSFNKPTTGITTVKVCADSGLLATEACAADLRGSRVISVEIATGTAPTETCNLHTMIDYCTEGQCVAGETCPAESVKQVAVLDWTREDYGESIVAEDNAYLLSTIQAIEECPIHAGLPLPEDVPPDGEGGDPSGEGGDPAGSQTEPGQTTDPGGQTEPGQTEPSVPDPGVTEDPSGGFGDENWFNGLWATAPGEPSG